MYILMSPFRTWHIDRAGSTLDETLPGSPRSALGNKILPLNSYTEASIDIAAGDGGGGGGAGDESILVGVRIRPLNASELSKWCLATTLSSSPWESAAGSNVSCFRLLLHHVYAALFSPQLQVVVQFLFHMINVLWWKLPQKESWLQHGHMITYTVLKWRLMR